MNQVCTALIFSPSPRRVANNEQQKRCISPPHSKFLSRKSRPAPLYTQPTPLQKQSNYVFIFRILLFTLFPLPSPCSSLQRCPRAIVFRGLENNIWWFFLCYLIFTIWWLFLINDKNLRIKISSRKKLWLEKINFLILDNYFKLPIFLI